MADPTNSGYTFTKKYRGCALIIVNETFWKIEDGKKTVVPSLTRGGSSKDCKKMKAMFRALDFKVKVFKDLTAADMENKIRKASQNTVYNEQSDCFALVISSHGEEVEEKKRDKPKEAHIWRHRVLGSDCNIMYIDDIMNLFKNDVAVELAGKPKLFIIQACRSRQGPKTQNFDYGVNILVSADSHLKGNPSDAGDFSDGKDLEKSDNFGDVEDVNADWINDTDDDEWTSDMESESSDEESLVDSNQDLSDAKGEPDTGVLPPPPDGELSTPALPSLSEVQPKSRNPLPELNIKEMPVSFGDLSDAKGSPDSGVMPPSPDKTLSQPALPGFCEKHPVKEQLQQKAEGATNNQFQPVGKQQLQTPEDKPDVKGGSDTGEIPQSPYNIVPIICPSDCILVYPVTAGYMAFRRADLGSRLLHCMQKKENFQLLVQGCSFLQYMTAVTRDMASVEIQFEPSSSDYTPKQIKELKENMPFKVTTNLVHRLRGNVYFEPKKERSLMSALVEKFKKLSARN